MRNRIAADSKHGINMNEAKGILSKKCSACNKQLPLSEFAGKRKGETRACRRCRELNIAASLRWYYSHPVAGHLRVTNWRKNNPEAAAKIRRRSQKKRKEQGKDRAYYLANKDRHNATVMAWKRANPEKVRSIARDGYRRNDGAERARERRKSDPQFAIMGRLRCRIYLALRAVNLGLRKTDTTIRLLGCSYAELRARMEQLFTSGMTWEKVVSGEIHLDHKRPCASFDLTDPEQQRTCFSFRNLQPLWAADNLRKSSKLNWQRAA